MMGWFLPFLLAAVGGYVAGSVSFARLLARIQGVDIRQHGSGNVGATNVGRVLGKDFGRLCFLLDFGKGAIPVVIARLLCAGTLSWTAVVAGAAAVAGHVWPCTLGFKGGKGVATSLGVIAALAPLCFVVAATVWLATFYATRYVSLASIAAAAVLPLIATAFLLWAPVPMTVSVTVLLWVVAALIVVRHKSNIQRLLRGEEHRFGH